MTENHLKVRFGGVDYDCIKGSFREDVRRDRSVRSYTASVDFELSGSSWQAFVDMLGPPPDSFDVKATIGDLTEVSRICREPIIADAAAGLFVWALVQGPRMSDGRWSPREALP